MIKFGSARIDERGKVSGGKAGDQTGQEVMIQAGYIHKNGWKIIRAKDPNIANALAWIMAVACQSDEVGYDQYQRYDIFFTNIRQGVPTECDCSSLVAYCVQQAGITNFEVNGFYTGNEIQRLVGTGAFSQVAFTSLDDLYTGDILVDAKGTSHTVIVVEGKSRINGNVFDEPEPVLNFGSRGNEVKKLQGFFNEYCNSDLTIDGIYGRNTYNTVKMFQAFCGLAQDGIYGQKTHEAVIFVLFCNNVKAV